MFHGNYCVDGHADILYETLRRGEKFYSAESSLQASWSRLIQGGIDLQFFSLFVDPNLPAELQLTRILQYIDHFRTEIEGTRTVCVTSKSNLRTARSENRFAAVLAMEGAHALQQDIRLLRTLFRLGVRVVGFTWNLANGLGDGVGESRGAGLTDFGRAVVKEMNRLNMLIDVAHLSQRGFWDVVDSSSDPFVVSHANAAAIYPHRRNLTDDQIKAVIDKGGLIGLTFVPGFISGTTPDINALLAHFDHLLSLGAAKHIGFGSDFDGIDVTMPDLRDASSYPLLFEQIEKRYGSQVLKDACGENWYRVLETVLPKET